jgi:phospholipid/cholesterol/gamma-HCH transport system substrate-binding protein
MIMNITPGRGQSPNIENGDILTSSQSIETQAMLSTLDQTNENFLQISDNLKAITDKMNAENGLISEILEDEAFSVDLKETVRNLNSMTRDLMDVSNELGKLVSDTKEGKGVLGYLLTDDEFGIKADDLLDNIDHQFIDRTGPVITDLQSITSSLNRTSTRIDSLVEAFDLDEGILGLLLKDQEAADQTEDLIDSIGVSVELFNENMEALRHNFLFKRYFKKKKKKEAKMLAQ